MHWDAGFASVYAALLLNLQTADELSALRYAHPAPAFQGIYLWDSAFISQVWKPWDLAVAQDLNQAVVQLRDGARLQHVVADVVQSTFTQPPLISWSVRRLHDWSKPEGDALEFMRAMYQPLVEYNEWLYQHRTLPNGLFCWAHPYESGIDNSPRFSSRDESLFADTRALAAPDFSTYMILQNESLAYIASELTEFEDAARFEQQAERLRRKVNDYLWDEEDGLFYDRHVRTHSFVRSKTIASLLPLWAGVPDRDRAKRLHAHIQDPDAFNTLVPLPSVACDDPAFAKDMWRGPVWINLAYAVISGLERYGYWEDAGDLAYRLCDGVYRTHAQCRRIYEFYDPHRYDITELCRKAGNRWKQFTLGNKPCAEFVGWSGLVNNLVIEHLIGYRGENGLFSVRPNLPPQAEGRGYSLRLPAADLALQVDVLPGRRFQVTVRSAGGTMSQIVSAGETVELDPRQITLTCSAT
jgi:hypothetical protein